MCQHWMHWLSYTSKSCAKVHEGWRQHMLTYRPNQWFPGSSAATQGLSVFWKGYWERSSSPRLHDRQSQKCWRDFLRTSLRILIVHSSRLSVQLWTRKFTRPVTAERSRLSYLDPTISSAIDSRSQKKETNLSLPIESTRFICLCSPLLCSLMPKINNQHTLKGIKVTYNAFLHPFTTLFMFSPCLRIVFCPLSRVHLDDLRAPRAEYLGFTKPHHEIIIA